MMQNKIISSARAVLQRGQYAKYYYDYAENEYIGTGILFDFEETKAITEARPFAIFFYAEAENAKELMLETVKALEKHYKIYFSEYLQDDHPDHCYAPDMLQRMKELLEMQEDALKKLAEAIEYYEEQNFIKLC
jgi:hypothetical protein